MYRPFLIRLILLIRVNDISLEIYYRQLSWILYTAFLLHVSLKKLAYSVISQISLMLVYRIQ